MEIISVNKHTPILANHFSLSRTKHGGGSAHIFKLLLNEGLKSVII